MCDRSDNFTLAERFLMLSMTARMKRSDVVCPILGVPSSLSITTLPTNGEIIRYWHLLKNEEHGAVPKRFDLVSMVATAALDVWHSSSIPTTKLLAVIKRANNLIDRYLNLVKSLKRDAERPNFIAKMNAFKCHLVELFDIAACKCENFISCRCNKENKVPKEEQTFLEDQRGNRKMMIGGLDAKITSRNVKKYIRKSTSLSCDDCRELPKTTVLELDIMNDDDSDQLEDQISKDPSFETGKVSGISKYNTVKLPNLAVACERTGISSRSAAMITSAILEDVGIVTSSESTGVTDRNKIVRQRKRSRSAHLEASIDAVSSKKVIGLYYDGKKDETLTSVVKGSVKCKKQIVEEHYTIVLEPDSVYKSHVTPISGSAKNISNAIFLEMDSLMNHIKVVGSDGTNTNVGAKGGVISLLEAKIDRPLQWCICLLHMNELPLRHLVKKLDGDTTGPKSFTGSLGKQLVSCESLPIVDFSAVPSETLCVTTEILSTDQLYLLKIFNAVRTGSVDQSLSVRDPGNISHSRWLTTANRFLRLYVSTEDPSYELLTIVNYIMKCYVPIWFNIKCNDSIVYGTKHLFGLVKRCKFLEAGTKEIVRPVIQRNAYFAHSENILLSMIVDDDPKLRKLAYCRIMKSRNCENSDVRRIFKVPEIKWDADAYYDLIEWKTQYLDAEPGKFITHYTEPPLLSNFSENDLHHLVTEGKVPDEVYGLPCHNQNVERAIKLVTESSKKACKKTDREGIIQSVISSRFQLPKFDTKKEFTVKWNFGAQSKKKY